MTVETETILIKLLEELKVEVKELRQDVNKINNNQTRLEGKIETLSVQLEEKTKALSVQLEEKTKALQNSQNEFKEEIKELKSDIKGRISIQTYWFLLLISLLVGIVGKFAFYPNV